MKTIFFDLLKRKERDIHSVLLADVSKEGITNKQELHALKNFLKNSSLKKIPVTIKKQLKNKSQHMLKKGARRLKKVTHYLSREVYDNLNKGQITFRRRVPEDLQSSISKSFLMNLSLEIILQEFRAKGEKHKLMHNIMQKT